MVDADPFFPSPHGMTALDLQQARVVTALVIGWKADFIDDGENPAWIALEPPKAKGIAAYSLLREHGELVLVDVEDDRSWAFDSVPEAVAAAMADKLD